MASSSGAAATLVVKDDPMDLGPFLKEYVLNNPFTQTATTPTMTHTPRTIAPRPLPVVAVKSQQPLLAAVPTQQQLIRSMNNQSPNCTQATTTMSQIPVLAVKALTSPIVQQVAPLIHHNQPVTPATPTVNPMALRLAASARGGGAEGSTNFTLGPQLGVTDTPKAHIGSNRNFAAMLREAKLPIKHNKVKKWLLSNYRHRGNSPTWLSSDDLLDHVHEVFEDLKGSVLSRIMKVTFPHCHKIINKYGYFYIGLVRRPEKQHYGDEILRMAAEAVSTGHMTSEMACQVHGVTSELLDRMVTWYDTLNEPVPEPKQVMTETESESDSGSTQQQPVAPRGNLKWKLRQKARSRLLTKICDVAADRDSSPDFNWTPENQGVRPYGHSNTRSKRRKRSNSLTEDQGVISVKKEKLDNGKNREEEEDEDVDVGSFSEEGDDDLSAASSEGSMPLISNVIGSLVKVKAEPVDLEYGDLYAMATSAGAEPNNNVDKRVAPGEMSGNTDNNTTVEGVKQSFHTLRNLLSDRPASEALVVAAAKCRLENNTTTTTCSSSSEPTDLSTKKSSPPASSSATSVSVPNTAKPILIAPSTTGEDSEKNSATAPSASGTSGSSSNSGSHVINSKLNSVVDLLTMKQELQQSREDLTTKTSLNEALEAQLEVAHAEITKLNETVSKQETQLFELASDFFELSNRFMKMTHKFKQALTDAKAIQSTSASNQRPT